MPSPVDRVPASPAMGCMMCDSLYVRANGEIPCWCDAGEVLSLRTIREDTLQNNDELPIFYGAELQSIRQSFMAGHYPHPGICDRCAVRGQSRTAPVLRPAVMEVLYLEASYLCHLSCPQCIPVAQRRSLRTPPYNITPALLEGLLQELRHEGVQHIRCIFFEGRGDPLMNGRLSDLIESAKRHYPEALTEITSHCSYPYKPWIARSGLDVLRASIDGATPKSYAQYRVNGDFERAIEFLRRLRDDRVQTGSALRVEWKYTLFEWNDSPSEMRHAAELAKELQTELTFVRTHTPGRSLKFQTEEDIQQFVRQFAPGSAVQSTFPLRLPGGAEREAFRSMRPSRVMSWLRGILPSSGQ